MSTADSGLGREASRVPAHAGDTVCIRRLWWRGVGIKVGCLAISVVSAVALWWAWAWFMQSWVEAKAVF